MISLGALHCIVLLYNSCQVSEVYYAAAINGVEESFVRAVIAERSYRFLVTAILDLVLDKEKSGPEVVAVSRDCCFVLVRALMSW